MLMWNFREEATKIRTIAERLEEMKAKILYFRTESVNIMKDDTYSNAYKNELISKKKEEIGTGIQKLFDSFREEIGKSLEKYRLVDDTESSSTRLYWYSVLKDCLADNITENQLIDMYKELIKTASVNQKKAFEDIIEAFYTKKYGEKYGGRYNNSVYDEIKYNAMNDKEKEIAKVRKMLVAILDGLDTIKGQTDYVLQLTQYENEDWETLVQDAKRFITKDFSDLYDKSQQ
jgi:hypothetical protein